MTPSNRYKILKNGYKFDLYIFRIYIILVIMSTIAVFLNAGGLKEYVYVNCPKETHGMCENQLYNKCDKDLCKIQYLQPGEEFGERPPSFYVNYVNWFWITIFIPFIINHVKNNKDFDIKLE